MTVQILDCTLRDGGYINNWSFTRANTIATIDALCEAKIDIIECGFINPKNGHDKDSTLYRSFCAVNSLLRKVEKSEHHKKQQFVVMINHGDVELDQIPHAKDNLVSGIRLAFHKEQKKSIKPFVSGLIGKGYRVFLQPMVVSRYTSNEIVDFLSDFSGLNIYAYYIVDSFGSLYPSQLKDLTVLFDQHASAVAKIGFHGHNNLQLAFANAMMFAESLPKSRDSIIDSSILGMGRGAGNVNTELLIAYCTKNHSTEYCVQPIIKVIDDFYSHLNEKYQWGYSIIQYLSATHQCHPSYANYLITKHRLSMQSIQSILKEIVRSGEIRYDETVAKIHYEKYIAKMSDLSSIGIELPSLRNRKSILIIAPGASMKYMSADVRNIAEEKELFTIGINHAPDDINIDACFISNSKRSKCIEVSNRHFEVWKTNDLLDSEDSDYIVSYQALINMTPKRHDNSCVLLLALAISHGIETVYLAGLDGFTTAHAASDYIYESHDYGLNDKALEERNAQLARSVAWARKKINVAFLTNSLYQFMIPQQILGIIPARYQSSRFPGKPLVKINGIEMIKRTYQKALQCKKLNKVVVATDDNRIYKFCESHGIPVLKTSDHPTGTDRVAEAFEQYAGYDFCINIQGDEPVIDPKAVALIVDQYLQDRGKYEVYTLCKKITEADAQSQTIVKVVANEHSELIYMSREVLPCDYKKTSSGRAILKQVCVYGFTPSALRQFAGKQQKSTNEQFEDIEIIRFLDAGVKVKLLEYHKDSISVDRPADVQVVEEYLNQVENITESIE